MGKVGVKILNGGQVGLKKHKLLLPWPSFRSRAADLRKFDPYLDLYILGTELSLLVIWLANI